MRLLTKRYFYILLGLIVLGVASHIHWLEHDTAMYILGAVIGYELGWRHHQEEIEVFIDTVNQQAWSSDDEQE